jgi:hypothetical protein
MPKAVDRLKHTLYAGVLILFIPAIGHDREHYFCFVGLLVNLREQNLLKKWCLQAVVFYPDRAIDEYRKVFVRQQELSVKELLEAIKQFAD